MARIIAVGPGGRGQAPERDDRFGTVIAAVLEHGFLDRPLLTPAARNLEHADEVRRAVYRSARYFCTCGERYCTRKYPNVRDKRVVGCPRQGHRVSCKAEIVRDASGKYRVEIIFRDKTDGIRHVVATYGPDPSKWPYQAKARRTMRKRRA